MNVYIYCNPLTVFLKQVFIKNPVLFSALGRGKPRHYSLSFKVRLPSMIMATP